MLVRCSENPSVKPKTWASIVSKPKRGTCPIERRHLWQKTLTHSSWNHCRPLSLLMLLIRCIRLWLTRISRVACIVFGLYLHAWSVSFQRRLCHPEWCVLDRNEDHPDCFPCTAWTTALTASNSLSRHYNHLWETHKAGREGTVTLAHSKSHSE